jgi:hypothetical protein
VVFFGGAEGGTLRVGDELQQEFDEVFNYNKNFE